MLETHCSNHFYLLTNKKTLVGIEYQQRNLKLLQNLKYLIICLVFDS